MPKKEYNTAKTIAMLLVVFGHAQVFYFGNVTWDFPMNAFRMQLENVISFVYCFHVHLFFFVSGALFKTTEAKQMSCGILPFIQKKASRLLLPYLGCFVFLLVPVRYLVGYYPSNWTESMKAVLGELIGLGDNGHLWFLPTLFLDYVLFYCIEKISKRHHAVGILTSVIVLYLFAFLIPDRFDASIRYLLWFTGGYFFDTMCYDRMRQMQAKVLIPTSAICLFTAFFLFHIQKKLTGIVTIPISMLTTALGICSILFLAYVCADKQSKLSCILEKYSYSVYIFHDPVNYLFLFVVGRLICTSTLSEGQYAVVIILKIMTSLLLAIGMRQCVGFLRKQFARHYSFETEDIGMILSQAKEQQKRKNYKSIDCLKFLLSIFVIGIHTSLLSTTVFGLIIQLLLFTMAVPLFFAVSGFFFYGKILKHPDIDTLKSYCKRLGKIYVIWTVLYIPHIVVDYQNRQGWGMITNGAVVLIRNIFFLGSYDQLWYLLASVWGGILLFFAVKRLKDEKIIAALCVATCVIAMLFDSCAGLWPAQLRTIPTQYSGYFFSVRTGLLFGFPFMGIGVLAYRLRNKKPSKAFLAAALFFLYRTAAALVIKHYDMELGMEIIPGTWGCTLFLVVWLLQVDLPISDALAQWLRKCSILTFLIHQYMIDIAILLTDNSAVLFVVVVALSLTFSGAVIALEQKKGFGWLKQLY